MTPQVSPKWLTKHDLGDSHIAMVAMFELEMDQTLAGTEPVATAKSVARSTKDRASLEASQAMLHLYTNISRPENDFQNADAAILHFKGRMLELTEGTHNWMASNDARVTFLSLEEWAVIEEGGRLDFSKLEKTNLESRLTCTQKPDSDHYCVHFSSVKDSFKASDPEKATVFWVSVVKLQTGTRKATDKKIKIPCLIQ